MRVGASLSEDYEGSYGACYAPRAAAIGYSLPDLETLKALGFSAPAYERTVNVLAREASFVAQLQQGEMSLVTWTRPAAVLESRGFLRKDPVSGSVQTLTPEQMRTVFDDFVIKETQSISSKAEALAWLHTNGAELRSLIQASKELSQALDRAFDTRDETAKTRIRSERAVVNEAYARLYAERIGYVKAHFPENPVRYLAIETTLPEDVDVCHVATITNLVSRWNNGLAVDRFSGVEATCCHPAHVSSPLWGDNAVGERGRYFSLEGAPYLGTFKAQNQEDPHDRDYALVCRARAGFRGVSIPVITELQTHFTPAEIERGYDTLHKSEKVGFLQVQGLYPAGTEVVILDERGLQPVAIMKLEEDRETRRRISPQMASRELLLREAGFDARARWAEPVPVLPAKIRAGRVVGETSVAEKPVAGSDGIEVGSS
jgi:hypothetical protein